MTHPRLDPIIVRDAVDMALKEDLGLAGDISSQSTVDYQDKAFGVVIVKAAGVIAGLELVQQAFLARDPLAQMRFFVADGASVKPGDEIAHVRGNAQALLCAERTALNFLGHLSGIATATAELVDQITGTNAKVVCTRKTTPGLRALEKFAVRCGGGHNHRFGLFDAVMIKDNHIVASGGIEPAIQRARNAVGHLVKIEVEVANLDELDQALASKADVIMLDNMSPDEVAKAVRVTAGRAILEASGGITKSTIRAYAETGVDVISVGWITHSAPNLDVSFDLRTECNFA